MPEQRITTGQVAAVVLTAAACGAAFMLLFNPQHFFDLKIYLSALQWWRDGHELFDYVQPDRVQGQLYFTYPPFAALLLLPFSFLGVPLTATLFTLGTVLAVIVTTHWLVRPEVTGFRPTGDRLPGWFAVAVAVPPILVIEPLRETIAFGQLNMLLVVLVLFDLLVLAPRGSRWTGAGIGVATAVKLIPGIFIVYLLASRQWRAALTSMAAAAGSTLLAAALAPQASWQFWTSALWDTDRVGRTDYTGNQSIQGLLSRLTAPEPPDRLLWLALAALVLGFGMWRAAKAGRAGDRLAAIALTGLVAGLISPITWPHHLYWLVPAVITLIVAGCAEHGARRVAWWSTAAVTYVISLAGVVTLVDWGTASQPTESVGEFLARNVFVLLSLALLVVVPIRPKQGVISTPYRRPHPS